MDDRPRTQESVSEDDPILSLYRSLHSRRVDLVGDYAGNELFLIDGDSLLLECFSDDRLDFGTGFQLLHAVYIVERFLHNLRQRKCNFRIVFFDSSRDLCAPASSDRAQAPKYLLARAAIIRHLSSLLSQKHSNIKIHTFQSLESQDFGQYLRDVSPYFVMVHDGAQSTTLGTGKSNGGQDLPHVVNQRLSFRRTILHLIARGYNIALINELQWQDTKVMASVLESGRRLPPLRLPLHSRVAPQRHSTSNAIEIIQQLRLVTSNLNEGQLLAVVATSVMLGECPLDTALPELLSYCQKFLLHQALIAHLPLSARRLPKVSSSTSQQQFLLSIADISASILHDIPWAGETVTVNATTGIADYVDGRLFLYLCQNQITPSCHVQATLKNLQDALMTLLSPRILSQFHKSIRPDDSGKSFKNVITDENMATSTILPFSNPVFDKHLETVHIGVDVSTATKSSQASERVFKEMTHWHNDKKPLAHKGTIKPVDPYQAKKAATRNQRFMAEMQKYAASLTNAVGKSLEPEVIIADRNQPNHGPTEVKTKKSEIKQRLDAKTEMKNKDKSNRIAQLGAQRAKQAVASECSAFNAWELVRKDIDLIGDAQVRFAKVQTYLNNLPVDKNRLIGAECEMYSIGCLVAYWQRLSSLGRRLKPLHVVALIWYQLRCVAQRPQLTKSVAAYITQVVTAMGLPSVPADYEIIPDKWSSSVPPTLLITKLDLSGSQEKFLLLHCGPYLERSHDPEKDSRVDFQPDGWQKRVLDSIDADRSVFVVAPTSAGKTFISFYAMRKVLRADDEGVLVYVAPTKALVNQIAAEIQARFSKSFQHAGRSVWAVHTRDYRINNPSGCQVLVTVPHILQIMLLSPANANTWSNRIKRIIFDEIHSIGQADDGVIWEQLLLMAPSPIIALSATVGNPDQFSQWLSSTQRSIGVELDTIVHPHRYSDLRKYYHAPSGDFEFKGLQQDKEIHDISLDGIGSLLYIHPVAALVDKTRGIPDDLALESRDCYFLWQAFKKCESPEYPVSSELSPAKSLPSAPRRQDILLWEASLKRLLRSWLEDPNSPFDQVVQELGREFLSHDDQDDSSQMTKRETRMQVIGHSSDAVRETMSLLCQLHQRDALPAIIFNYDRHLCEVICGGLLNTLISAETEQVKSGPKWAKKLEDFENWKKMDQISKAKIAKSSKSTNQGRANSDEAGTASKLEKQREMASSTGSKWESFDPTAPVDGYHFADPTKLQASELAEILSELRDREINSTLLRALSRGIGVHHAGMNRKYRQVVEMLFRRRFLRVVIATGTLALGINMPCKTVVFAGDSIYLTALNYRQCAGRSGRRGFDLLGNVVFQDISKQKVCRLISSRLPDLNGHFPITTSLVLRMFILLHESNGSSYAKSAIDSILSQPRLYLGGESFKEQTMHHLRFSIEYLRRQQLLSKEGIPINPAGLVSHLYYTENSSFAFHALIREGYFNGLCANIDFDEDDVLLDLMLVMAHLFNRIVCRRSDAEFREEIVKKSSSMVFLPPLPEGASQILHEHNLQTQSIFETYVRTFVDQHISYNDDVLPLTGAKCGGTNIEQDFPALTPARVRSSFVALSGSGDTFTSIHDLCSSVRSGVFLEEAVIPYVQVSSNNADVPLNAWLLDFYKHGDVRTLEQDNGIRKSDVWFYLNDFSLVLATIVTSLSNFMSPDQDGDDGMLDLQGEMDVLREAKDDTDPHGQAGQAKEANLTATGSESTTIPIHHPPKAKKKKAKVLDSWDDDEEEEEETIGPGSGINGNSTRFDTKSKTVAEDDGSTTANLHEQFGGLEKVSKAFRKLQERFNEKFKAMWA